MQMVDVRLTVNGKTYEGRCEPRLLLADFCRENLVTHRNPCGLRARRLRRLHRLVNGGPARSCIMFAVQANGATITTVEGLADGDTLHPLQQAFHEHHGLQCGFCTPGMLIAALDFLRVNPEPTETEVREALSAELCRCTGYQKIVEAVMAAAETMRSGQA